MNYIHQLQETAASLDARVNRTEQLITELRAELLSDKFKGTDCTGERKDWMATGDIEVRLLRLREALMGY